MEQTEQTELTKTASIVYLTPENAEFYISGAFLALNITEESDRFPVRTFSRVILRRAFPFDLPYQYLSVFDGDENEIGIIADIGLFQEETQTVLKRELARFYYTPKINRIVSVKERYGFSYWDVITENGPVPFTVQDTFRNLLRIGEDRLALFDVDGNRFEIVSVKALDRKSFKKIELYL